MKSTILILILLSSLLVAINTKAAECLPNLGGGNLCTGKNVTVTETVISGPASYIEGEIIPGVITWS